MAPTPNTVNKHVLFSIMKLGFVGPFRPLRNPSVFYAPSTMPVKVTPIEMYPNYILCYIFTILEHVIAVINHDNNLF